MSNKKIIKIKLKNIIEKKNGDIQCLQVVGNLDEGRDIFLGRFNGWAMVIRKSTMEKKMRQRAVHLLRKKMGIKDLSMPYPPFLIKLSFFIAFAIIGFKLQYRSVR